MTEPTPDLNPISPGATPKAAAGPDAPGSDGANAGAAPELPRANVERRRIGTAFWLVPLMAALACGWLFYRDVIRGGPMITIYFEDADGLEVNNTEVRYRGAQVGRVKSLAPTPDNRRVAARVRLIGPAEHLARSGSVYWIVRPELRIGSISGLRTIISGEYIAVQPGNGPPTNTFFGADREPPIAQPNSLRIVLLAADLSTLQDGSPIMYRGIEVGEVLQYALATNAQDVVILAGIREEYAPLVRRNSVFWNAGRFDVSWGLFRGARISADSPAALLTGAIEFATPNELQETATNGMAFRLNDKAKDEWKTWTPAIRLRLPETAPAK